jgi:spore maturation protein CgeB
MKIVIYGLTITSSWGNGHATTFRSLVRGLARNGHRVEFVEKDVEWYRNHRDLGNPGFCSVHLYDDWFNDADALMALSSDADAIVIGSYYPDAIVATKALLDAGRGPLLFYDIDTPITVAQLRREGKTEYLEASLIPKFDTYLSFSGGPLLADIEREFGARGAVPLYCSVDPDLYRPLPPRRDYASDLSYLGTYSQDRQPKLMSLLDGAARLLPHAKCVVAGPQYPPDIKWQPNVKRIAHLAPPEHASFYSSARFTLNLTRADMVEAGYSPSVRLFEASACGAAILSDNWPGLAEFLTPGEEILLPKDAEEVRDILAGLSDDERRRMGARARERILSEHTSQHRASQFEEIVSRCRVACV